MSKGKTAFQGFFASSKVQQERPGGDLIAKCGSCGLYRQCNSPKMKPYGQGRRGVLVVGEAPGETEDAQGRPFIGKAGQHLREALNDLGYSLDSDAVTTNSLICRPPDNKTPDVKQIGYCRANLISTIKLHAPRVIVTLGRSALVSVLMPYWKSDVGILERWVGWKIPLQQHWVCPTYHPSYLLRMNNELLERLFRDHLKQAFEIEEAVAQQPINFADQVEILYDDVEVYRRIREIDKEGGWVAVDYETNCLKPEYPKSQIVSCAISNGKQTISYPWVGKAIEATGKFLRSNRTLKIASNLKFEDRWTRCKLGHPVTNWGWDTMLAAHCLDNRPGICSLKFQSLVQMGIPSYNETIEPYFVSYKGLYNRIEEIEIGELLLYGGADAVLEFQLAKQQRLAMER